MGAKNLVAMTSVCIAGSLFSLNMLADGAEKADSLRRDVERHRCKNVNYSELQNISADIRENSKYSGISFLLGMGMLGGAGLGSYKMLKLAEHVE